MYDLAAVNVQPLAISTAGTATAVVGTSTTLAQRLPRSPALVSLSAITTGTSIVGATCIVQASHDMLGWVALSSATVLATNAGATTAANSIAVATNVNTPWCAVRAIVTSTGTGWATAYFGA